MYPTDYPGHVDIQATLQECAPHGGRARPLSATVCSASYASHNSYYAESFLRQQIFSDFRFAYFAKFSPASKVLSKQSCRSNKNDKTRKILVFTLLLIQIELVDSCFKLAAGLEVALYLNLHACARRTAARLEFACCD